MEPVPRLPGLAVPTDQPLIGLILEEEGRGVVRCFVDEADAALPPRAASDAPAPAGARSHPDWDEPAGSLDRIRHETEPIPPLYSSYSSRPGASGRGSEQTERMSDTTAITATSATMPTSAVDVGGFRLPAPLRSVGESIEQSRSLLELEDDWDGEGTQGYAQQTWRRAADFIVRYATALWEERAVATENVAILPSSNGALAIDWRTGKRELLITVPDDPNEEASFYGDDGHGGRKIKGTLDTSVLEPWLVSWLAE